MKLWALSDLHVGYSENRRIIEQLPAQPDDWLVLGGDLGESADDLRFVLETLGPRFRRLFWVPGNHELWTLPKTDMPRGEAKYLQLVELCRRYGVLTPEDPYEVLDDGAERYLIAPLFTLYDYSFCPPGMTVAQALDWALEAGLQCTDEHLLFPDPYPSRSAWCAARCAYSEARLTAALQAHRGPTVLIDHFPLLQQLAVLPAVPRFSIWCGTTRTHDWHRRFRAAAVIFGHLHIPQQRVVDGVRFTEASLGYPRQWSRYPARVRPRQILPVLPPEQGAQGAQGPQGPQGPHPP